jgi:carbamoyltransferase
LTQTAVLGINAAHDAAACLLIDGQIAVALPEERLARTKWCEGFPAQAIQYCLRSAGLASLREVDAIVVNEYVTNDYEITIRQAGFTGELIVNPSHHLLHAYYAWVAADYESPAILILDGAGYSCGEYRRRGSPLIGTPPEYSEMEESESMYSVGDAGELSIIRKTWGLWEAAEPFTRFPSLGHMFSAASEYIFGHMQHAGKTMGLAPYGDASFFPDPIISYTGDGLVIDTEWIRTVPPRSADPAHLDPICRNMAAKVQAELEVAVLHLCRYLHEATGADDLCLSGGVGLNSVTNGMILRDTPFRRLFVTPAAGDSGVAIGAAFYGHHQLTGKRPVVTGYDNYHGHAYRRAEVIETVRAREPFVRAEEVGDMAALAARDIADGKFVAWFEGGSEFGPRALGHRSIICDPRPADMRDRLNEAVKFREPFRPYAASVLTGHVREFFDVTDEDPFMMKVAPVRADRTGTIASVCHVDGTCRIQTVDADHPGNFRRLIECFHELSGIPLVLNTSFNIRGESIVETPDDALCCFLSCNLDVLYLDGLRISKLRLDDAAAPGRLVPLLNESVTIGSIARNRNGAATEPEYFCQTRTGHRTPVRALDYNLLLLVDGQRSVAAIARVLGGPPEQDVAAAFAALQRRGLVSVGPPDPAEPGT